MSPQAESVAAWKSASIAGPIAPKWKRSLSPNVRRPFLFGDRATRHAVRGMNTAAAAVVV